MILDKKFLASSKYGKQGLHQKQVAGHQINPVRAKTGKKIKYPRPHELTEAELKEQLEKDPNIKFEDLDINTNPLFLGSSAHKKLYLS